MSIIDILLIAAIAAAVVRAVIVCVKKRPGCGCTDCSGCRRCWKCRK